MDRASEIYRRLEAERAERLRAELREAENIAPPALRWLTKDRSLKHHRWVK